jgi:hypothetical protein
MTAPPTPKPTRKAETLAMAPPTTVSRREEDAALKEVAKPRLCCANGIFETKTKDGSTAAIMSFENDIRLVFVTKPSRKQNLFFPK